MHVQRRCVGEDLATSLHGAEDVGPHFFGELRDGGFYYFSWLRHRRVATFGTVGSRVPSIICLGRDRSSHVSMLTVHPVFGSRSELAMAAHPSALPRRLLATVQKTLGTVQWRHIRQKRNTSVLQNKGYQFALHSKVSPFLYYSLHTHPNSYQYVQDIEAFYYHFYCMTFSVIYLQQMH